MDAESDVLFLFFRNDGISEIFGNSQQCEADYTVKNLSLPKERAGLCPWNVIPGRSLSLFRTGLVGQKSNTDLCWDFQPHQ